MKRLLTQLVFVLLPTVIQLYGAEVLIEGTVELPRPKGTGSGSARWQKGVAVAEADKPSAVVFLEGKFTAPPPAAGLITQKGFQFRPALLPVLKGAKVEFANLDDDYHSVFSFSPTKEFDLGRYRKEEKQAPAVVFDKAGFIRVGCEIHDHMQAIVLVLETPHFVRTDPEGKGAYQLVLKDVPTGKYTLKAWLDPKTIREKPVELKDSGKLQVDFPAK